MIKRHATIEKASHYFAIKDPTPAMYPVIYQFSSQYTKFKWDEDFQTGRKRWVPDKTFALHVNRGQEFRFHRNQFDEFMRDLACARVDPSSYEVVDVPMYVPATVELEKRGDWQLYPEQIQARRFITESFIDNPWDNRTALLNMPMGTGKTKTACETFVGLGYRIAIVVAGKYVKKWVKDLQDNLALDRKDIVAVQGADILQRCTLYPGSGIDIPKAFVISLSTINMWYKLYENDPHDPRLEAYGCKPYEFMQHLAVGAMGIDEAHEQPHLVFKALCYTHVPLVVALTATLLTKDPVIRKVQSMMFPLHRRFTEIKMKKYITSHSCVYQIFDLANSKIQTTEYGRNNYSHAAFEKSILRNKRLGGQFVSMAADLIADGYVKRRIPGDKAAIFVSTKEMAEEILDELETRFPTLDVRRYFPSYGDPYENILEADMTVTTMIAGGTAIDIPGLRSVFQLVSVDSPNANVQTLGRLREIKHRTHDTDVHFYYLYCSTIPKQVQYHHSKIDLYEDRILEHKQELLATLYP